jgi:hypothetical protein
MREEKALRGLDLFDRRNRSIDWPSRYSSRNQLSQTSNLRGSEMIEYCTALELSCPASCSDALQIVQIIAGIMTVIAGVVLGYWISEASRKKEELERDYASSGHPFSVLLREAEKGASEITRRHREREEKGLPNLIELSAEVRTFIDSRGGPLESFTTFYRQKQAELMAFPTSIAAPLTGDDDLNSKLWKAYECARRGDTEALTKGGDQEQRILNWLSDLSDAIGKASSAIKSRYRGVAKFQ